MAAVGQRLPDVEGCSALAPLSVTYRCPVLSRKVATVFVPADSKERSDESVIELTVPIEAEATGAPEAITTSEFTPGMPAGLQLFASSQSELTAPVHVDLPMMRLLTLIAASPWAQTNFTSVPVPLSGARVKSEFE
jgi:hypothetical protein